MRKISADIVFTVQCKPIINGIVLVGDDGEIAEVLDPLILDYKINDVEMHTGAICPGFVNTHCHLELSYLKNKIEKHTKLNGFINKIQEIRKEFSSAETAESIRLADALMEENGIVAVGDICNTSNSFDVKQKSSIYYHNFIETFASNPDWAIKAYHNSVDLFTQVVKLSRNNSVSITPHAPYSLSKKLFSLIKAHAEENSSILSIHHQESEDENVFFSSNKSLIMERSRLFGVEKSDFENCGLSPLEAVSEYLPKQNPFLLVHNTVSSQKDIDFAHSLFSKITWCFCPNANLYIENRLPDIPLFVQNNCRITLGTDSFASNNTLSILEEIRTIQKYFPQISFETILRWATLNGAEFLGIQELFGSIESGKSPGINLISDFDLTDLIPTSKSKVERII